MQFHTLPEQWAEESYHRCKISIVLTWFSCLPNNHRMLVPVWCHLGMCQTETRNLQPISCLVLSNTVSLHLPKECNVQAIGGKYDFSGYHM